MRPQRQRTQRLKLRKDHHRLMPTLHPRQCPLRPSLDRRHPRMCTGTRAQSTKRFSGSWAQVLDWLRENAAATGNLVSTHGQPQGIRNGTLEIAFTAPGLLRAFGERHTSAASRALKEVLGIALPVTGVVSGFGAPQPGTQPAPQPVTSPEPQPAQPASTPAPNLAPQTTPQPATPPAPQPATPPSAKRELPEKPGKEMAQAILGGQFVQSDPRGRR